MFNKEKYKFLLSSLIMLFTIYILSVFKGAKDTVIITNLGAELISTIKLYGVLPSVFLCTLIYTKLTNHLTRIQIYHLLNWAFVIFFVLFGVFLYPNASLLHWDPTYLISTLPQLKYHLIMLANWSYSLFYICSELWGSMMLALMFWQLMNQICTHDEARRSYPLFNLLGELGALLSGFVLTAATLPAFANTWDISLKYICISALFTGAMISFNLHVLSSYIVGKDIINGSIKKKKNKLSIIQSLKYIAQSKHIALLALILISYGASINLIEAVWKKHISLLLPNALEYCNFIASIQIAMSIVTIIISLCGYYILPRLSWRAGALITPLVMIITAIPFVIMVVYRDTMDKYLWCDVLLLSVYLGGLQNILSKATKYSFFEPTKEMVYIPLDEELKSKGKGVADMMGERFGKASGSAIQWIMLSFVVGSNLVTIAPYLFVIFLIIITIWIFAVFSLSKEIKTLPSARQL